MKERAQELKAEARANKNKAAGESDVLAKINRQSQRAGPLAEDLVRDARVCQGRQGGLLLPRRS
jgi:hypothetical protein